MKLKEIYELAIKMGVEADPRGRKEVKKVLEKARKDYQKLDKGDKKFFDKDKLKNPYADTRVLAGDPEIEVKGILAGIDLEVGEVVLADRLREKGEKIDLLLAHHPEGKALAALHEVMGLQADIWHKFGVPINIGDVLISERAKEVFRSLLPVNHARAIDAARLLNFAYMSVHTPADNLVSNFLQKQVDQNSLETVGEVVDFLKKIPEYKGASYENAGPTILVGDSEKRAGKIMVDMTGGTEGPEGAIEKLAQAGVGTLVCMHMGDKLKKKAEESKVNVIIAGHIASDNIGLNLFLDQVEKRGVKILTCSGLTRVKRS